MALFTNRVFQISIALLVLALFAVGQQKPKHAVVQRFPLTRQTDGMDGELRVLMDSRINAEVKRQMWNQGPWDIALLSDSAPYRSFQAVPSANARLEIADGRGIIVWEKAFSYPLVEVRSRLLGTKQIFFVTVDDSAGYGSYSGLTTTLFSIGSNGLKAVEAFDLYRKVNAAIVVAKNAKAGWKEVLRENSVDLLAFYCVANINALTYIQPHNESSTTALPENVFLLHYVRYRFDNGEWNKYERVEAGYWESDQPLPPDSSFPE